GVSARILRQSDGVRAASNQMAAVSQDLARSATAQASSLQETSAAAEQIRATARKCSSNSRAAAELVTHSQERIAQANRSLEAMVLAITEIGAESQRISGTNGLIDEVARAIAVMEDLTHRNAARAEEGASAVAELKGQSGTLHRIVEELTIMSGAAREDRG